MQGRVRLTNSDRWFFIQLYRWFPSILKVLTIIRPETLVRWHRAGFRRLCVPKTLSTLMRWQNRLSWRNDWVAVFIPCSRDRAMQVKEPA